MSNIQLFGQSLNLVVRTKFSISLPLLFSPHRGSPFACTVKTKSLYGVSHLLAGGDYTRDKGDTYRNLIYFTSPP